MLNLSKFYFEDVHDERTLADASIKTLDFCLHFSLSDFYQISKFSAAKAYFIER